MIIFGASGDLTKRKLMPALYSLYREKRLTGEFSILGIGRTVYSDDNYRSEERRVGKECRSRWSPYH